MIRVLELGNRIRSTLLKSAVIKGPFKFTSTAGLEWKREKVFHPTG